MISDSKQTSTLRDYLKVIFRHKSVVIVIFITIMISTFIGLEFNTPVYEANVKMLVSAIKEAEAPYYKEFSGGSTSATQTQREIATSNPVIARVAMALRVYERPLDYEKNFASALKSALLDFRVKKINNELEKLTPEQRRIFLFRKAVEELKAGIKVEPLKGADILIITVRDFSPVGAAIIANAVSRSYVIFDLEQQIAELKLKYGEKYSTAIQLQNYIENLQKSLDGRPVSDIESIGPASVKIIEQAVVPLEPMKIVSKPIALALAFFTGIFLGIMFAFGFEYLDQTFKSPQDVEGFLKLPLLGAIPKRKAKDTLLIKDTKLITDYTQSYRNLSDQIYLLTKDKNLKSILITDAEASEETPAVIANLGIYLSHKAGHKALIIDANLRTPSIHRLFNISNKPGLADVLEGKTSFDDAIQNVDSTLFVLPAGDTIFNPSTILDSFKLSNVIKTAKENYEMVFVACADLKNFTDAVVLSSNVNNIVLVINEGKIRRQVVKSAIAPLEQKKVNLIGVILNNRSFILPKIIYKLT